MRWCLRLPQNFEEYVSNHLSCFVNLMSFSRVKIVSAAFFLQGSVREDIAPLPQHVQYAVDASRSIMELR